MTEAEQLHPAREQGERKKQQIPTVKVPIFS